MIHFLPDPETCRPAVGAERLAGLGRALTVVEQLSGDHGADHGGLAAAWVQAGEHQQRLLDDWSDRAATASAAALEALSMLKTMGLEANPAAIRRLADAMRTELDSMGAVLSL